MYILLLTKRIETAPQKNNLNVVNITAFISIFLRLQNESYNSGTQFYAAGMEQQSLGRRLYNVVELPVTLQKFRLRPTAAYFSSTIYRRRRRGWTRAPSAPRPSPARPTYLIGTYCVCPGSSDPT